MSLRIIRRYTDPVLGVKNSRDAQDMKSGGQSEILNSYENMSDPQPVSYPNFLKHADDKYMIANKSITDDALGIFRDVRGFLQNIFNLSRIPDMRSDG